MLKSLSKLTDPRHVGIALHDVLIVALMGVLIRAAWMKGPDLDYTAFSTAGLVLIGALVGGGVAVGFQRKIDPSSRPVTDAAGGGQ